MFYLRKSNSIFYLKEINSLLLVSFQIGVSLACFVKHLICMYICGQGFRDHLLDKMIIVLIKYFVGELCHL